VLVEVDGLPNWYMSIRFRGMGSRNGGCLRVVGFFYFCMGSRAVMLPICGRSSMRALWSPYSGVWMVIFVFFSCSVWLYLVVSLTNDLWMLCWYICVYITEGYMFQS